MTGFAVGFEDIDVNGKCALSNIVKADVCYFLFQSESAEEKERELTQELSRIQHEVGECPETSKKKQCPVA